VAAAVGPTRSYGAAPIWELTSPPSGLRESDAVSEHVDLLFLERFAGERADVHPGRGHRRY
jgi:hypothetical protein